MCNLSPIWNRRTGNKSGPRRSQQSTRFYAPEKMKIFAALSKVPEKAENDQVEAQRTAQAIIYPNKSPPGPAKRSSRRPCTEITVITVSRLKIFPPFFFKEMFVRRLIKYHHQVKGCGPEMSNPSARSSGSLSISLPLTAESLQLGRKAKEKEKCIDVSGPSAS